MWAVQVTSWKKDRTVFGTACADRTARLWTTQASTSHCSYTGHTGSVNSIRFLPNGESTVCTAGGDGEVHVWDFSPPAMCGDSRSDTPELPTGRSSSPQPIGECSPAPRVRLCGHLGPVYAADWSPDGEMIVSGRFLDREPVLVR